MYSRDTGRGNSRGGGGGVTDLSEADEGPAGEQGDGVGVERGVGRGRRVGRRARGGERVERLEPARHLSDRTGSGQAAPLTGVGVSD
jgi:hypothetical protein